jgi:hypothetical protein
MNDRLRFRIRTICILIVILSLEIILGTLMGLLITGRL